MQRIVLASNNAGKLKEMKVLLEPLGRELVAQGELGIAEAEEPYASFLENALAKARHAAHGAGGAALADDSGLCVHALGGAPGVHSARFAGEPRSDERNNRELIERLAGRTDRAAYYVCVLVLMRHPADPDPLLAQARWHGTIIDVPRGTGGFGYDPHFLVDGLDRTAAELDADEKNQLSHRGQALRSLIARLRLEDGR